jgi:hypothetical protein
MDSDEFKKHCKKLIRENGVEFLLNNFLAPKFDALRKDVVDNNAYEALSRQENFFTLILARLNALKYNQHFNLLHQDTIDVNLSKINHSCISLVDGLSGIEEFMNLEPGIEKSRLPKNVNALVKNENTKKLDFKDFFKGLKTIESLYKWDSNQPPLIGIYEIGYETPNEQSASTGALVNLLIDMGRIGHHRFEDEVTDCYKFEGTNILCFHNFNKSTVDTLKERAFGVMIPIVQINTNKIPHLKSLQLLKSITICYKIPIIFAFMHGKEIGIIDEIKNLLAYHGIVMEELGGPFQCQDVSFSTGSGIQQLIEKIFLELEFLDVHAKVEES